MTLQEFQNHISTTPPGTVFKYGISEPFSWRGVYNEIAFSINEGETSREEILAKIQMAYENTFHGYKGGYYRYRDYTEVHFEESPRDWSDGGYCAGLIAKIEGNPEYKTQEHRLVNLAFSSIL